MLTGATAGESSTDSHPTEELRNLPALLARIPEGPAQQAWAFFCRASGEGTTFVYKYIHTYMYVCMYGGMCIYVCMYVCMYDVRMYVCRWTDVSLRFFCE